MIEIYDNLLQIAVLLFCINAAGFRAVRFRSRSWSILGFFFGSWMLGDLYWLACLVFYKTTPQISVISDLNWYASFLFLYLLLRHVSPPEKLQRSSPLSWLGPVFAAGMAVFFMFWGEIISNLIYAGLMGLLLFSVIRRLADKSNTGRQRFLLVLLLAFCLLEYSLWTASCFWNEEVALHPYYLFDLLVTLSFLLYLPAVKKAVTE